MCIFDSEVGLSPARGLSTFTKNLSVLSMEIFSLQNWQNIWGAIVLMGLPLLFALATFVYRRRKPSGKGIIPPQIMRYLLVPFLAIYLVLHKIYGIPSEVMGIKILETLIIIILISFLFNAINYLLFSPDNILTQKEIIPKLGRDVLHMFFITIISACVLSSIWDLDLGNLLTALGVSSLVVGLALQEPLGNLFNGISILMANPFSTGDWIRIGEAEGKVAEINWRSIKIHTRFNEQIIIPNNMLGKEIIKNLSRPDKVHIELLKYSFSYDDSPEKVKAVLFEIAQKNERILAQPEPAVFTLTYDDYSITYGIKAHIRDYEDIILLRDEIAISVYATAKENGLTIPFPRQEIDINERKA